MRGVRGSELDLMSAKIFKAATCRQRVWNKSTVFRRDNRLEISQLLGTVRSRQNDFLVIESTTRNE